MKKIIQLLHNLSYLSRFNIKTQLLQNPVFNTPYQDLIENILYYIPQSSLVRPAVHTPQETVRMLLNTTMSLARFGDGELALISGQSISFQEWDEELANKLKHILTTPLPQLAVGINYWYFFPEFSPAHNKVIRTFNLENMPQFRKILLQYIRLNIPYYDAGFTGYGFAAPYFNDMRTLWDKKHIITVGCQNAFDAMQYNIFDNASRQEKLLVPRTHAFRMYKTVLADLLQANPETLVILMCGPLSKVLAYDLCAAGRRALDLGHLAKSYDYYKQQIPSTAQNTLRFYLPD